MTRRPARLAAAVLLGAFAHAAHAGCSLKPNDAGFEFSDEALAARDAFYASLCDESFAELIALPDPRLDGRLSAPADLEVRSKKNAYPQLAANLGLEGGPVVAFVVETDGSIRHGILIQSSEHRLLDEAAVRRIEQLAYGKPATLDGLPVRTLVSMRVPFRLNGSQALPASLTDATIIDFGNRFVDYVNGGDADGLYVDLDDVSRAAWPRQDIKRQLWTYAGLYGRIVSARYAGMLAVQEDHGIVTFPLAYDLALDRPGEEDVMMTLGITVHSGTPRIASFSISRAFLMHLRRRK